MSDTTFFVSVVGSKFDTFEQLLDKAPTIAKTRTFTIAMDKYMCRIKIAS